MQMVLEVSEDSLDASLQTRDSKCSDALVATYERVMSWKFKAWTKKSGLIITMNCTQIVIFFLVSQLQRVMKIKSVLEQVTLSK